jgi:transcriptional regulator with XRE-family HTH domain
MIGKYIWYLRIKEGLSLEAVSEKSGIKTDVLKEFEEVNISRIPNADLAAIAKAFTFKNAIDYFNFLKFNGTQRHFRLYAFGLPKTGTVSLYGLFGKFRSGHEFWQWDTNQKYLQFKEQAINRDEFRNFLILRDAAACLDMDSAYFNRYYIDILSEEFADAKFICLIRDPESWVKSQVNYFMDTTKEALQSVRIDNGFPFDLPRGDQVSRDKFLLHIDEYIEVTFKSWANAYRSILGQTEKLNPERYCFIWTNEISCQLGAIAKFAGIPETELKAENVHSNKAVYQVDALKMVGPDLIAQYYNRHCKDLWDTISNKYE